MKSDTRNFSSLMSRLSRAGFKDDFARSAILPDWWDDECASDASVLPEVELRVARFLRAPLSVVQDPRVPLALPSRPRAQLRRTSAAELHRIEPAVHAAVSIAAAVVRSLRSKLPPAALPVEALEWHALLAAGSSPVTLGVIAGDLWERGIPVIPVSTLPSPKFQGAACLVGERPVIVIAQRNDEPGRVAFWVAHEAGHVASGDCAPDGPVIDEEETPDRNEVERRADQYAQMMLLGNESVPDVRGDDFLQLRDLFAAHVDVEGASETDRALLSCVDGESAAPAA